MATRAVAFVYADQPLLRQVAVVMHLLTDHGWTLDSLTDDVHAAASAVLAGLADVVVCAYERHGLGLPSVVPVRYARRLPQPRADLAAVIAAAKARGATDGEIARVLGIEPLACA